MSAEQADTSGQVSPLWEVPSSPPPPKDAVCVLTPNESLPTSQAWYPQQSLQLRGMFSYRALGASGKKAVATL